MSVCRRLLPVIASAAILLIAGQAHAVCSATVSIAVAPPTVAAGADDAIVTVIHSFTGSGTGAVALEGFEGRTVAASGTTVFHYPMSCRNSGPYLFRAIATPTGPGCNTDTDRATAETTITVVAKPTISASPVGMTGDTTLSVDTSWVFPLTGTSQSNREIRFFIDGVAAGNPIFVAEKEGSAVLTVTGVNCLTTGQHVLTAQARSCGLTDADHNEVSDPSTFDIQASKIKSVDFRPGSQNSFIANVGYAFQTTAPNSNQRLIASTFNGSPGPANNTLSSSGNVDLNFNWGCLAPGTYPVTFYAVACGYFGWDPAKTDRLDTTVTIPIVAAKGTVDLNARFDPATRKVQLTGSQTLPPGITSATRVIRRLATSDELGNVVPGDVVQTSSVSTGSFDLGLISLPTGARQFQFDATLEFCNGLARDVASVDCGCDEATLAPVYLADGNMRYTDIDPLPPQLGRIALVRTYDSHHRFRGSFGRGWWSMFDRRLTITPSASGDSVALTTETNESVVFARTGASNYVQHWPRNTRSVGTLTKDGSVYRYRPAQGTFEHLYRISDGRYLGQLDFGSGRQMTVAYDGSGLPLSVTDSWTEVTWAIVTDTTKRRITSVTAGGLTWTYQYDANDNLATVLAPGNAIWRTYEHVNDLMTATRDALGNLIESHDYDANGVAINSIGQGDEIESLQYDLPGSVPGERITRITLKTGAVTDHVLRPVGGGYRTVQVIGDCLTCGGQGNRTYVRDQRGRIIREQRADGFVDLTVYAGDRVVSEERNLKPVGCDPLTAVDQCRMTTDALQGASLESTTATLKTEYTYADEDWPERVTRIRTPSVSVPGSFRDETYTYHALTGDVINRTTSGHAGNVPAQTSRTSSTEHYENAPGQTDGLQPAFDPAGTFPGAWLSLPQPALLARSIDGPRTDVQDLTSFVYYPVDSTVPALLRGRLAATKNAAGHITRFESYDQFGNATRVVEPNGVATEMSYDALGRLSSSTLKGVSGCDTGTDPLCATNLTTTRAHAPIGGPVSSEVRPGGGTTSYTYDGRGRMRTLSRGPSLTDLREQIEYSYDSLSGMKSLERILGLESGSWVEKKRESYAYTADHQLATITHADGTTAGYVYDAAGRVASARDENHTQPNTTYSYDPAGRLQTVKQTLSSHAQGFITTSYGYDVHGNLTAVTDPNGNVTTYRYDDFGQLVNQVSPVTGTTVYGYDLAGNLTLTQMANNTATTRTFDELNRSKTAISTTNGAGAETVTWTYDDATAGRFGIGRVATMVDHAGTTTYRYERRGMVREETRSSILGAGMATVSFTTKYRYDLDGNRSTVIYPSNQLTVTYTYDHASRPLTASSAVTSAEYLPFGPLKRLDFANGTRQMLAFDNRYRVAGNQLVDTTTTMKVADYGYQTDPAGNIERIDDLLDPGFTRVFGYDDLHRLTSANTGPSLWGTGEYTWDAMGNILSLKLGEIAQGGDDGLLRRKGLGLDENRPLGRSSSFAYAGTTPRLTEVTTNHLTRRVLHDAAGNETAFSVTRQYSARNLMTRVDDNNESGNPWNHSIHYGYDGRGVRVRSREYPEAGEEQMLGIQRHYLYSPELQLLAVSRNSVPSPWDPAADPVAGQLIHKEMVWFGSRPVAQVTPGGGTHFTFADHLGTPILQTDVARSVIWRAEYEPFGNIYEMRAGTRIEQPLRFPGQEVAMNWEGLEENYNIFRWYRAGWGRYTQADPIGLEGGWNLYRYAAANPLTYVDPLGLKVCRCDRRLAFNAFAFSQWFYPAVAAGAYHTFIQIVPNGSPCGGYDGLAWGFQDQGGGIGHVEPERTPAFNPMLRCREVPCIDETLLRRNVNSDSRQPAPYRAVCRIGSGWNAQNCQGWADDVLQRSRAQTCCYAPGQGGPL